jgi:hypothetical protein
MSSTTKHSTETLGFMKKLPGGKVSAVHRWGTGYQMLVFKSREEYEWVKAKLESKTAEIG